MQTAMQKRVSVGERSTHQQVYGDYIPIAVSANKASVVCLQKKVVCYCRESTVTKKSVNKTKNNVVMLTELLQSFWKMFTVRSTK